MVTLFLVAMFLTQLFSFGLSWVTMRVMVPVTIAEFTGLKNVGDQVNMAFKDRDTRLTRVETEVKTIKDMSKTK